MPPAAPSAWDAPLQQLLASRVLDGYGLLDHTGKCLASFGSLAAELWGSSHGGSDEQQQQPASTAAAAAAGDELSPTARQLLTLFNSNATPDHLNVCGQQAIIVQRSDSSVYAVSRGKQMGLTAHFLPAGIVVAVFSKPQLLQTVAPQVEAACDRLRQG